MSNLRKVRNPGLSGEEFNEFLERYIAGDDNYGGLTKDVVRYGLKHEISKDISYKIEKAMSDYKKDKNSLYQKNLLATQQKADQDKSDAEIQKGIEDESALTEQVKNYQTPAFQYNANDPFVLYQRRLASQNAQQAKQDFANTVGSAGIKDSGMQSRVLARYKQGQESLRAQQDVQNYGTQYNQFTAQEGDKYQKLLNSLGAQRQVKQSWYDLANKKSDDYFKNLAVQQQEATNRYSQQKQSPIPGIAEGSLKGIGTGATVLAGLAAAGVTAPWLLPVLLGAGAVVGGIGGGVSSGNSGGGNRYF